MNRYDDIREKYRRRQRLYISLLLLLLAVVTMTAAAVAWFTIADKGRVNSMNMEVTSGASLRFDLDQHGSFSDYVITLQFQQIAGRIQSEHGFDMRNVPLEPVTTSNGQSFMLEDGTAASVNSGAYLEFKLHFIALSDMTVHLTSSDDNGQQGTEITSNNNNLINAMRISFTADGRTSIYDPGMGNSSSGGTVKTFGLPKGGAMSPNAGNALFSLKEEQDKEVIVRIWLEGTDENCTSDIRGSDYSISLRFIGTDEDGNVVED